MTIQFSQHPGIYERDQQRRYQNPLFQNSHEITSTTVEEARQRDQQAYESFITEFQKIVQKIVVLDNQAESQTVLDLKIELDKSFEASATLPGDLSEIRTAIQKLMQPIMQAVQVGAGDDQTALAKLEREDNERAFHFTLLETALIADILSPSSLISTVELPATLLSADLEDLQLALTLFSAEQLDELTENSSELMTHLKQAGKPVNSLPQFKIIKSAVAQQSTH